MEAGTLLGDYEILEPLGAGGMGEVYRARDPRLEREVAIKVLPAELSRDPERLARLEREARVLASLEHPNVAAIHGLEQSDGVRFLVMQLAEGETLADRLVSAAFPVDDAVEIAEQIADGLEAAHEQGVVHRDLKPANIMVASDGRVKILDFGLAKALGSEGGVISSGAELSASPTMLAATGTGMILGTAAYMSPEQARGKPVDRRTDIWAFGCVLYEMLTGRSVFEGETATDVLASIVREEPEWAQLPEPTPLALRRLLERCLRKDPRLRLRDIGDARIVLREILDGGVGFSDAVAPSASRGEVGRPRAALILVAILAASLGALGSWLTGPAVPAPELRPTVRATIALPPEQRQPRLLQHPLAITRDGSLLAYVARGGDGRVRLYLRPLDGFESRPVPGSEDARAPFFSPDGEWLGFVSYGALRKVPVVGGEPLRIADASSVAFGASWGPDGSIVYARTINSGLWRISAQGGEPEQLTQPDFGGGGYAHTWPQHVDDGRGLLYGVWGGDEAVKLLDLETGETKVLAGRGATGPYLLPTGHLIYSDNAGSGRLLAAPLDLEAFALRAQAVPVLDDVRYMDSQSAIPYLAVSDNGTAVYASAEIGEATILWVARDGATEAVRTGPEIVTGLRLSPDGRRALFSDEQGGIWLLDVARGSIDVAVRSDDLFSIYPVWHPDGERLVVSSNEKGSWSLHELSLVSDTEPDLLLERDHNQYPASFSADGSLLAFVESHPETASDVWVLPEDGEPVAVARTPADESAPTLSPNGSLIAYTSEESGRRQVYLQRFPGSQRIDISLEGGEQPTWSRDGRELFFRRGERLMQVDVSSEPELGVSRPLEVFEMAIEQGSGFATTPHYDVSLDGQRFLVVSERPTTGFKVVFNWFEELRRRVLIER